MRCSMVAMMRRRHLTGLPLGRTLFLLAVALTLFLSLGRPAPSQARDSCAATGSPFGPFDLQAYEHADYKSAYARSMELAGANALFPELPSFALPPLETGGRDSASTQAVAPFVPPVLLKAIGWIESGWSQADYSVPYGGIGAALTSHDCGYGIMQITSGMQNVSGIPSLDQAMIGGHYAFNIARGARILADKWNMAPESRPVVGSRNVSLIEDWYYALWGYNGFAFKNHPLNPDYQGSRPAFSCAPDGDGFGHDRSQYPYQELVLGCAARPPVRSGTQLWPPQETHLPDLSDPAFAGPLRLENWSPCSSSLQCASMDMPTPNTSHADPSSAGVDRAQVLGSPAISVSPASVSLVAVASAIRGSATVTIANAGTGLLAYRATTTASWLKLSRSGGVALGTDLGGQASSLVLRADLGGLPPGNYTAGVNLESLYSAGSPASITVTLRNYPDGTLLVGSASPIYLMKGGLRRAVPDPATLFAIGFNWANVVPVADSLLAAIPQGRPLLSIAADGTLVVAPGTGVFVLEGGLRRHVAGPDVMDSCGYRWDAIRIVPGEALSYIPPGGELSAGPCPRWSPPEGSLLQAASGIVYEVVGGLRRAFPNQASMEARGALLGNVDVLQAGVIAGTGRGRDLPNVLANGNLLLASGPDVFVMDSGKRRRVTGPNVMSACGYGWDAIKFVSDGTMASLPMGEELARSPCPRLLPPDGALVLGSSGAVYLLQGGKKRYVPNPQTFLALGLHWGDVDRMPDSDVDGIPTGDPVPDILASGTLLLGAEPAVFVMENGQRRWVRDPGVMEACGYSWGAVAILPDAVLSGIPRGPDLTGPPCP